MRLPDGNISAVHLIVPYNRPIRQRDSLLLWRLEITVRCLYLDDFVQHGTTQQHKTHISKYQEIYYPWHPWYGRSVLVRGSLTRRDRDVYRCTIEDDASKKSLEVPHWMFDRAVCCGMKLVDAPVLGVCELRSLKALLGHAGVTTRDDLRQDQHCLSTPKGDVDAKTTKSSPCSSAGPISSTSNHTPVVNANSLCERVIGTLRRECLDFLIPLTENHLLIITRNWVSHYNRGRPHSSLGPGIPDPPVELPVTPHRHRHRTPNHCKVVAHSVLGGLHHEYGLLAKAA